MRYFIAIILLASLDVFAQSPTVFITENTLGDLNPQRDALTANAGSIRIHHTISDGDGPVPIIGTVRLQLIDKRGSFTNSNITASYTNQPGQFVWVIPSVAAGTNWLLYAEMVRQSGETNAIFDRWLTVTSAVSASASAMFNFYDIGANNVTGAVGRFTDLYVDGTVSVAGGFEALDSTKVAKIGETNAVILTNAYVEVSNPTNDAQAANKGYVDDVAGAYGASEWATNTAAAIIAASSSGDSPWQTTASFISPTNPAVKIVIGDTTPDPAHAPGALIVGSSDFPSYSAGGTSGGHANIIMRPRDIENNYAVGVGSFYGTISSNATLASRRGGVGMVAGNYVTSQNGGYPQFMRMTNVPARNYAFIDTSQLGRMSLGATQVGTGFTTPTTPLSWAQIYYASNDNDLRVEWNVNVTGGNGNKRMVVEDHIESPSGTTETYFRRDSSITGRSVQVYGRLIYDNAFSVSTTGAITTVNLFRAYRNTNYIVLLQSANLEASTNAHYVDVVATNRFNIHTGAGSYFHGTTIGKSL